MNRANPEDTVVKGRTIMFKRFALASSAWLLVSSGLLACGSGPTAGSQLAPAADQQHIPVNAGQRIPPSNPQIATTDPQAVATSDPQAVPPGAGDDTGGVEIDPEDKNCEKFCAAYEGSECAVKGCREYCPILQVAGGACVDVLLQGFGCLQGEGECDQIEDRCQATYDARASAACSQYVAAAIAASMAANDERR